jgi:hypothetical protein
MITENINYQVRIRIYTLNHNDMHMNLTVCTLNDIILRQIIRMD